jgi:tartrate-resistant acid phosphatase type 5
MKRLLSAIVIVIASTLIVVLTINTGFFQLNITDQCDVQQTNYELPALSTDSIRFAVIGDFGAGGQDEANVASLLKSWNPDFVVSVGDNNYPHGAPDALDSHIGQYYHQYIGNYQGTYGEGADVNRFFPALGNHDWMPNDISAYLQYFSLTSDQRYYTFTQGDIQFFMLDSDPHEPDGITSDSLQAAWLQEQLAASTATFKVVVMHHPPFSSGNHGSTAELQWDYAGMGADIVLTGHDHTYERIIRDGFPYIVNGLGGQERYTIHDPVQGSLVRYNCTYGAMVVDATSDSMTFRFITAQGELVDSYTLHPQSPDQNPFRS